MADVEELLDEQKEANLQLQLLEDNKEIFEDLLSNSNSANDILSQNSDNIATLESSLTGSIEELNSSFANIALEQPEPSPITVQAASSLPAIINENEEMVDNQLLLVAGQNQLIEAIRDVTPTSDTELIAESNADEMAALVTNAEEQTQALTDIAGGVGAVVDNTEPEAAAGVDRQKDTEAGEDFDLGKAGIIGAAAIATGALVKSVFDGLTDDKLIKDITGKARGELTASEETFAVLANSVETLTLGLFSAKEVFETAQPAAAKFQEGVDALFDPSTGVFSDFTNSILKLFDGDIRGALSDAVSGLLNFPASIFELGQRIGTELLSLLPTSFTDGITDFLDPILEPVFGFFNETLPEAFNGAVDTITDSFDFILSIPTKITDAISGLASDAILKLEEKVKSATSDLPFGIGDKIAGLFDGDDTKGTNETAAPSTVATIAPKEDVTTGVPKEEGLFSPVLRNTTSNNVPQLKSPPITEGTTSVQLSKQRLDEQKVTVEAPAPQTIIVPEQKREEKKLSRRKESNDMTLAFMGIGNF